MKNVEPNKKSTNIDVRYQNLTTLQKYPASITGYFDCGCNLLITLRGAPSNEVGMSFDCTSNMLVSLEHSPQIVGGDFNAYYNNLKNLVGGPRVVGGGIYLRNNSLTSLEGFPDEVGGCFDCTNNLELPRSELYNIVDRVKGNIYYTSEYPEDKDQLRRERVKYISLQHPDLGNLDI